MRGHVIDLAVGVIIGAAFGKIVTSLVNDILMPPLGRVLGQVDFSNLYLNLSTQPYASLAEAQAASRTSQSKPRAAPTALRTWQRREADPGPCPNSLIHEDTRRNTAHV